jgi:oligoendopeptidase F
MAIPFKSLPANIADFPGQDWSFIEPFFEELENAPLDSQRFEEWLAQRSRLFRLLIEFENWLSFQMDGDTADKAIEEAFLHHNSQVNPKVQAAMEVLRKKLLDSGLNLAGMEVPWRSMRNASELFDERNLFLFEQENVLLSRFGKIQGAQTVIFDGSEKTLQQLDALQRSMDRDLRERSWKASHERRIQDREAVDQILDQMMDLRLKAAANCRFDSYEDFRFRQKERFDCTPAVCLEFAESIEACGVPLRLKILEHRRAKLGLDRLKPWDLGVGLYTEAKSSFKDEEALAEGCQRIFERLDPEFGGFFKRMKDAKTLDLGSRMHKRAGAYCNGLPHSKGAFILMNATGRPGDIHTLLHESGHAFHIFLRYQNRELPYSFQLNCTAEFNEAAAMSMELLALPYVDEFFNAKESAQFALSVLESAVLQFTRLASFHLFEHWLYENPGASHQDRHASHLKLHRRFMPGTDWTDLDDVRVSLWQTPVHIFKWPFYFIQYAFAQVGALQIWRNSLKDPVQALKQYKEALSLGGTKILPELFKAAGADFDFSEAKLGELMKFCEERIDFYRVILEKT